MSKPTLLIVLLITAVTIIRAEDLDSIIRDIFGEQAVTPPDDKRTDNKDADSLIEAVFGGSSTEGEKNVDNKDSEKTDSENGDSAQMDHDLHDTGIDVNEGRRKRHAQTGRI